MVLLGHFRGDGLRSRALRGTAITLGGTGGQQALRLLSNLVLTRLLFPEAFGLMALIQTFMIGLAMFSDLGIGPAIIQSDRGEEPDFLNTAWVMQILRGICLWLVACGLAWPLAVFYDEPQILALLPVVGLNALIVGFGTTKLAVTSRRIDLGRQTAIGLGSQLIGLVVMIGLALIWPSVWALVIGGLIGSVVSVWLNHLFLPGMTNRLRWDPTAARELMGFGKFIFLSTIAGFFVNQGDKLVLGRLVSLTDLGIYNIAFGLAAFPGAIGNMLAQRILFPLYREIRPSQGSLNLHKIRRARNLLTGSLIGVNGLLALTANLLVVILYDPRYAPAGPMLVIFALAALPNALIVGNSQLLLAEGNSKDFSKLVIIMGVLNFVYMFAGFWLLGMMGILLVKTLVTLTIYPLQQVYLAKHKGTDLPRDAIFALLALAITVVAVWVNWSVLAEFYAASRATAPSVTGSWAPQSVFGG
ncbi:oligosaccharide flippase family protein [Paracoccus homiensis]|uniref:oligosaccharide flippase family protein n=1 Tax=Paracoccus homiensis TaxID=364199 RepID=UPI00398C8E4C